MTISDMCEAYYRVCCLYSASFAGIMARAMLLRDMDYHWTETIQ